MCSGPFAGYIGPRPTATPALVPVAQAFASPSPSPGVEDSASTTPWQGASPCVPQLQAHLVELEVELAEARAAAERQAEGARAELQEARRQAALLETMVAALRERLKREEDRNAALAGGAAWTMV
ncbi:hypothetical protein GPECTOR_44g58 [Gonium pectorale]|uniref:Uncharacterized protein n=1 Tax=Gonium pectorale TaxID=33097 RepID=A0A150G958_GONPE|nr:hypothetical protein GPECTOR_44g58 [Gonium pectorale]|eukprot:KXZ46382.1 hypothetical protein GPECTOR_44g58 [Gonium pectorale]